MADNVKDTEQGGQYRGCPDSSLKLSSNICCCLVHRLGWLPLHGPGHRGVPVPGGEATDGEAPTAEAGQKLGVHLGRGRERGGGV